LATATDCYLILLLLGALKLLTLLLVPDGYTCCVVVGCNL